MFMKKVGRNDPCPCGSGKKFKKCCESKMLGGKFVATKIETTDALPQKMSNLTGFFQTQVAKIAKISDTTRSLKPEPKPETPSEEKPKTPSADEPPKDDSNKEIEP